MGRNVAVITGPGVPLDRDNLSRLCGEWARECGVGIETDFADDEAQLISRLDPRALGSVSCVVLNPGRAADSPEIRDAVGRSGRQVAWVDLAEAESPRPPYLNAETISIRGRGISGYRWALLHLLQRLEWPCEVISYGDGNLDQVADLWLPAERREPYPVAVLLHGGFWRERWERDTIEPLAIDLARSGFATWNVEYRRVGPYGGGWPNSFEDVGLAIDHLAELARLHPLDLDRVFLIGHSAGGQLALWAVARSGSARRARVNPRLVVSLAGVADLAECARRGVGDTGNAAAELMGGTPEAIPDLYQLASPMEALPVGVDQLVVQGRLDNTPDLVDLTHRYVTASRAAGDTLEFLELDDADHFDLIDPSSPAWAEISARISRRLE